MTRIGLIYADFLTSLPRVGLIVMHKYFKARHPGYMDVNSLPFVYHF